jgi:hypothetical protein
VSDGVRFSEMHVESWMMSPRRPILEQHGRIVAVYWIGPLSPAADTGESRAFPGQVNPYVSFR